MTLDLNKVADVLEKTAAYLERAEAAKLAEDRESRVQAASDLAEKLANVSGENVDDDIVEKLSALDPDISAFLGKIAGSTDAVDSMGEPDERTKTASSPGGGDNFVAWVTGP